MRFGGFEPLLAAGALGHQDVCLRLLFVFCSGAETAREIEVTKFDANRRAVGTSYEEPPGDRRDDTCDHVTTACPEGR